MQLEKNDLRTTILRYIKKEQMYHFYLKGFMTYRYKIKNIIFFLCRRNIRYAFFNQQKDSLQKFCLSLCSYRQIFGHQRNNNYMCIYIHRVVQIDELRNKARVIVCVAE